MHKKLLYLFLFILAGCNESKKSSSSVFFSGEIVNPSSKHVVLFKGDVVIDSSALDENNMFSFKFDSIEDGLYHFNHDPEYQYVFLEKGDSLLIRLNTVDFDESLVYSGTGEEINNFMMEIFLANEGEKTLIDDYYSLNSKDFSRRIDSLQRMKIDLLNELKLESQLSEKQLQIAEANIIYNYAIFKERYPFRHKKVSKKKEVPKLSKGFYAYRNELTYNNKDLTYLRPYYEYMVNHFGNLSYMSCSHGCDIKDKMAKNHLHFNKHKLKLIDSLVEEKELKDNLFRNVAIDYLLKVHDSEANNKIFIEVFHALSGNNRHIDEIDGLYEGIKSIQPNKRIPNIEVSNFDGEKVSLQRIAKDNKTVFYFWSGANKKHLEDMSNRVIELRQKRPDYNFVGINVRTKSDEWKSLAQVHGFEDSNQYRAEDFEELTRALIIYPMNKCIITENEMIVNAFGDMYRSFK
ncbi:TlpA family protein disulfide reductase [Maribacter sp. HTCC2170]|uniref:TlpA family protein disulfide reductase n=1 Tax=Maribacter sp. (strain HTCC2170 / KCCM 42371) TaxID=313603 RepID=UPI00006B21F4|nr:transaldolase [Maribacter sp. HTCC2170]EAR00375.1 transaldolase [Maribacter sp. HTCC2170]